MQNLKKICIQEVFEKMTIVTAWFTTFLSDSGILVLKSMMAVMLELFGTTASIRHKVTATSRTPAFAPRVQRFARCQQPTAFLYYWEDRRVPRDPVKMSPRLPED